MIIYSEGDTNSQQSEADKVLGILCDVYPGHPWAVRVIGGCVFIRHLEFPGNWGMNAKFKEINHDSAVFKREIIMKAGEFLERAGLVRGRYDDSPILRVEGVPERFQPVKPPITLEPT